MTKKTYTSKEINKKMNEYFSQYVNIFKADRMSFAEFALIKSVITDLQVLFDKDICNENEQLKKAAKEFAQNQTQHNLWRLRTVLKDSDME